MIVDVHVHIVDPALVRRAAGRTVMGGWGRRPPEPMDPASPRARLLAPMSDPALMLADMDRIGIDVSVLSSSMVAQNSDWADADEQARFESDANDHVARWVAAHPDRFVGLATLPLKDPRHALAELDRAVAAGLKGVALPAFADGDYLGAARFEPVWSAIEERGLLVFVHPDGARDPWYQEYALWNSVGQPVEEARFLASVILEGTLERHPRLKIVVSHGGGYLPHYFGRLDRNVTNMPDSVRNLTRKPSEYLADLYYDTCVYDVAVLDALIRRYGPGHVVMGSDYPVGEPDPVAFVRRADGLSDGDVAAITGGTVARLLEATA
jgi:aminocarboxymuconate-semialdehyde decarboxylase